MTTITEPGTLKWVFWALLVLAAVFYAVGHKGHWDRGDIARAAIPPLAFVGWTMAQKSTAFDAVWPSLGEAARYAIAAIGAVLLGLAAKMLADRAQHAPPS